MTKEELLQHHIMVIESFDRDYMNYLCNLGYLLLYLSKDNNSPILVSCGDYKYGRNIKTFEEFYTYVTEEKLKQLPLIYRAPGLWMGIKNGPLIFPVYALPMHCVCYKYNPIATILEKVYND